MLKSCDAMCLVYDFTGKISLGNAYVLNYLWNKTYKISFFCCREVGAIVIKLT